MFGIGGGELILIIFIALMLFGSDKIPDVARTMGKAMAQLKMLQTILNLRLIKVPMQMILSH